jgi:putative ABC transport system substrate-binding protein
MIGRRELIALLGSAAAAWPAVTRGQPSLPVVGFLSAGSPRDLGHLAVAFRQGLSEGGFVEGRNVTLDYRWAGGRFDQVPGLAQALARSGVSVIATGGTTVSLAAKAATAVIPIVFVSGVDALQVGLVRSLNRPDANLTGVNLFSNEITTKRVQLLHELVPAPASLAMIANPAVARATEDEITQVRKAAESLGRNIVLLPASTDRQIDETFAAIIQQRIGGALIQTEPFLTGRHEQLVLLTTRHAIPTVSGIREFPLSGGLMSYGPSLTVAFRQIGSYAARILRGDKPADLPVLQPTKFELIVNLKAARALGIHLPTTVLALADEVIE